MVDSQPSEEGAHGAGLKGMGVGSQEGPFKPASLAQETPFLAFINENIDILRTMIKELDQQTKSKANQKKLAYDESGGGEKLRRGRTKSRGRKLGYQEISSDYESEGDSDSHENLNEPYKRPEPTPFTARITRFKYYRRAKLPRNITMYDGNKDLEDHLSILSADAKKEEWPMSSESSHINGVPLMLCISAFKHDHGHLELAKKHNDKIPKTVDKMFERVRAFIRGEVAAGSAKIASPHNGTEEVLAPVGLEDRKETGEGADLKSLEEMWGYAPLTLEEILSYPSPRHQKKFWLRKA
ncbi:hypothetical protein Tco_0602466 [Tanacetum coccineum]